MNTEDAIGVLKGNLKASGADLVEKVQARDAALLPAVMQL